MGTGIPASIHKPKTRPCGPALADNGLHSRNQYVLVVLVSEHAFGFENDNVAFVFL